jgi:hypothetical protein
MGKLNIRGYFTIMGSAWKLHQGDASYPLAGLRSVTVTDDNQIILDLPGRKVILKEEVTKSPLTATNSQEAHEIT